MLNDPSGALLYTKFYIPPLREDGVLRPRLSDALLAGLRRPRTLALLCGPAGFGKTTLLAEAVGRLDGRIAWLSLDESDNDPARFWMYLIAACAQRLPGVGAGASALLRSGAAPPAEAIATLLINDIAAAGQKLTLILDDVHAIQDASIHAGLAFLLERQPENLHVAAATRLDPPWPLGRWRARNRLVELRAAELRFTPDEAALFLQRACGAALDADDTRILERRIEGWAAGLQLAAASLRGRSDAGAFLQTFSGSHTYVAEYLVEEVLQREPPEMQAFLLNTALLERFNAGLCQAVTENPDSAEMLVRLQRGNLFLTPLDESGGWFRYHALFAELLQARLRRLAPAEQIAGLHRRAAAWFASQNLPGEAITHALAARDHALAERLIEHNALPMILQGRVRTVEGWLNALPRPALEASPRLNMAYAWLHLLESDAHRAEPYLQRIAASIDAAAGEAESAPAAEWLALQARLALMQGRPDESRALNEQALQRLPAEASLLRSMARLNLASAHAQMLEYERAAQLFEAVAAEGRAAGDFTAETLGISAQAQMLLQQGCLERVAAIAQAGIERFEALGQITPFAATLYGELGQVNFYRGDFEIAQALFLRSSEVSRRSGFSDAEIYCHVVQSRMRQIEGDWQAASAEIETAAEMARRLPPAMIGEEIVAQQARVHLAFGRLKAAGELLAAAGFDPNAAQLHAESPTAAVDHPQGLLVNCALRWMLAKARREAHPELLQRAIALAGGALAGELRCKQLPVALETLLLRAELRAASGDERAGLDDLAQALALAEPEGILSAFLEAGPQAAAGLARLAQRGPLAQGLKAFAERILIAFPQPAPVSAGAPNERLEPPPELELGEDLAPIENLTPRELEVLRWIAAGASNAEIAARLVISISAVKKHSANIYAKLNVVSRTQAVARARRLGLLG